MRAAAQNPVSSRLVGIRVGWMLALGWGLAAAIGAVAGMMVAPIVFLDPNMMGGVLLYAFAGALLGGIDSPGGAVLGGFIVGVLENLVGAYRRHRAQADAGAGRHHRRARRPAVGPVRQGPRGAGVTRPTRDRREARSRRRAAAGVLACALPFVAQQLPRLPVHAGAGLRDRAARPQHADRLQRPDLARPRRVLRDRRLQRGDPDGQARRAVLGDDPARRRGLLRRRLPVRPAGAAPRGPLPRARHLRARRGDAADPQARGPRAAGPAASQGIVIVKPDAPDRSGLSQDQWLYFFTLAWVVVFFVLGLEPAARPDRPGAGRDPRSAHRGRGDGHQYCAGQVADLRRLGASTPASPARSARSPSSSWRPIRSTSSCRSPCWSAS